jgi:hypothetical protein
MEDTTGLVRIVRVTVEGLAPGTYTLDTHESSDSLRISGPVHLTVPITAASAITLERHQAE